MCVFPKPLFTSSMRHKLYKFELSFSSPKPVALPRLKKTLSNLLNIYPKLKGE